MTHWSAAHWSETQDHNDLAEGDTVISIGADTLEAALSGEKRGDILSVQDSKNGRVAHVKWENGEIVPWMCEELYRVSQ